LPGVGPGAFSRPIQTWSIVWGILTFSTIVHRSLTSPARWERLDYIGFVFVRDLFGFGTPRSSPSTPGYSGYLVFTYPFSR
jgi:hypothetical protein